MSVSPVKKEKSNLVRFPYRQKKHPGMVGSFLYENNTGLLSGRIPVPHEIALEMVAWCQTQFRKHGIDYDRDFDFQNNLIRLVERYTKI